MVNYKYGDNGILKDVLTPKGEIVRKFRASLSDINIYVAYEYRGGQQPYRQFIYGPGLFRELTLSEIKTKFGLTTDAEVKKKRADAYQECLTQPFAPLLAGAKMVVKMPAKPKKGRREKMLA